MTSVKVKFRPSTVTGKMGSIYYQVIHGRMVRQINTNYKILSSEWNQQMGHIVNPHSSQDRFSILQNTREKIKWDQKRLIKIITSLDKRPSGYTADEIVFQFHQNTKEQSLFTFMQYIIKQLKSLYRIRTAETYQTTLNSFMTFREGHDILFDDITSDLIQSYQAHLQQKGISMNTISFYMRILRATYNRAVDKELTTQHYPFRHVYTGIGKTVKRAVPVQDKVKLLGRISDEDLPAYYGACKVFCLSSIQKTEAFGIVQIEAMSCSKPLIATRIPQSGVSWVNAHGESGLNVAPENARELAEAIQTLTHDENTYRKYTENAGKRFQNLFTQKKMIDQCLKIYESL